MRPPRALLHALFVADWSRPSLVASPWRERRARLALVPLALVLLAVAAFEPWYSNLDVDTMTHFMQIRGVVEHGVLGVANGPVAGHPQLTPRWLIPRHGLAVGVYPPIFSYAMAPGMLLGGFRGVIRELWLALGVAALFTYALTWRLTQRPFVAVASAYALALTTSLGLWGTMCAPFIPTVAFASVALYLATRAFDPTAARRTALYALGAGIASGFAVGSHLLWTLPLVAVGSVFALYGTLRERAVRLAAYGLGATPTVVLMAAVNHWRFGTWNPFSYGPCDLGGCLGDTSAASNPQNGATFVTLYTPLVPYVVVFGLALFLARRSRRDVTLLAVVVTCAAFIPDTELRRNASLLFRCLWAYLIDAGNLDVGYPHFQDGLGSYNNFWAYAGPWCVRSVLQCSPLLVAAVIAPEPVAGEPTRAIERPGRMLLAAAALGVLAMVDMRAHLPGAIAIGFSFVNHRYMTPLLAVATVLAFSALATLPVRLWHALVALAVALGIGSVLFATPNDDALVRRQFTLWSPLALALALWTCVVVARLHPKQPWLRHLAALLAALAVGFGGAISYGVDGGVAHAFRGFEDARVTELARCTPQRFVLMGGLAMDESLVLSDRREIYFVNLGMSPRNEETRALVDQAMRERHWPAFIIEDTPEGPWHPNWAGFTVRAVPGCPRIRELVRR